MKSSSDSESVGGVGAGSTCCPDVENSPKGLMRTQPERTAKTRSFVMVRFRENYARLAEMRKDLSDATCLIKSHVSGRCELSAHHARNLLLQLGQIQRNCWTLEDRSKRELLINRFQLENILAEKTEQTQFNVLPENFNSQLSSVSNQYPAVQSELRHDKVSPSIEQETSKNVYHLTDGHLVRIAAKIKVPYADLKQAIVALVDSQSDGSCDESASVIVRNPRFYHVFEKLTS